MLLSILQCTRQPHTTKNYPTPYVDSTEVEKCCTKKRKVIKEWTLRNFFKTSNPRVINDLFLNHISGILEQHGSENTAKPHVSEELRG